MNDLDYIFNQVKSKYQANNGITDMAMKLSEDLDVSYTVCWRLLRNNKFTFTRKLITKINATFPNWDWDKALR